MASPRTTSDSQEYTTTAAVFARHFQLERAVETASTTAVWRATDRRDNQHFALKFFPPELIRTPADLLTVRDMIVPVRQLAHPHVVAAWEVATDHDFSAIVTPWIDAPSFVTLRMQQAQHCFAISDIEPWVRALVDVLATAHARGVVHGALTPHVVFVHRDAGLLVTGFGINAWLRLASRMIFGPAKNDPRAPYASPAVRNGALPQPVDDIYAFGAIVYELITGEAPRGPSAFRKHRHAVPMEQQRRKQKRFGTPIPATWESLVQACLEPDASRRLQSFAEIRSRLGFIPSEPPAAADGATVTSAAALAPAVDDPAVTDDPEAPAAIAEPGPAAPSSDPAPASIAALDATADLVAAPETGVVAGVTPSTQAREEIATTNSPATDAAADPPELPAALPADKREIADPPVAATLDSFAPSELPAVEAPVAEPTETVANSDAEADRLPSVPPMPPEVSEFTATAIDEISLAVESVAPVTDVQPSEPPAEPAVAATEAIPPSIDLEVSSTVPADDEVAVPAMTETRATSAVVDTPDVDVDAELDLAAPAESIPASEVVAPASVNPVAPEVPEFTASAIDETSPVVESVAPVTDVQPVEPPAEPAVAATEATSPSIDLEVTPAAPANEVAVPAVGEAGATSAVAETPDVDLDAEPDLTAPAEMIPASEVAAPAFVAPVAPAATGASAETPAEGDEFDADLVADDESDLVGADDESLPSIWEDESFTTDELDEPEAPPVGATRAGAAMDGVVPPASHQPVESLREPIGHVLEETGKAEIETSEVAASDARLVEQTDVVPEVVTPPPATEAFASEVAAALEASAIPGVAPDQPATLDDIEGDTADDRPREEPVMGPDLASGPAEAPTTPVESVPAEVEITMPDLATPVAPAPGLEQADRDEHPVPDGAPAPVAADAPVDAVPPRETIETSPPTDGVAEPAASDDEEAAPVDTTPPFIPTFAGPAEPSNAPAEVDEWRPHETAPTAPPTEEPAPIEAAANAEVANEPAAAEEPAPARTFVPMEPLLPRRGPLRHVPTPADQPRVMFPRSSYYERHEDPLGPRLVRRALVLTVVLGLAAGGWWGWKTYQREQEYIELWRDVELFPADADDARREALESRLEGARQRLSDKQWRSLVELWEKQPGNPARSPLSTPPDHP